MSTQINLPTEEELYGTHNKKKEGFITLNIYEKTNEIDEDSSNKDNNQTETN